MEHDYYTAGTPMRYEHIYFVRRYYGLVIRFLLMQ